MRSAVYIKAARITLYPQRVHTNDAFWNTRTSLSLYQLTNPYEPPAQFMNAATAVHENKEGLGLV